MDQQKPIETFSSKPDFPSIIKYKNKEIIHVDYSKIGQDKNKVATLLRNATEVYKNYPLKGALTMTNVTNLTFDMPLLKIFQEEATKTNPYEKKTAVVGVRGLLKVAYNFVCMTKPWFRMFDNESDALEWLTKD